MCQMKERELCRGGMLVLLFYNIYIEIQTAFVFVFTYEIRNMKS